MDAGWGLILIIFAGAALLYAYRAYSDDGDLIATAVGLLGFAALVAGFVVIA